LSIVRFPDVVDVGREVPILVAPLEQRFASKLSGGAGCGTPHFFALESPRAKSVKG
jgi:hypothetical protein